jgi:hypothetical protein
MDRICDVWASVPGDIHQHSDNDIICPGFVKLRTGDISVQRINRRRRVTTVSVGHVSDSQNFIVESSLRKEKLVLASLSYLNSEKRAYFPFISQSKRMSLVV